MSSPRLRLGRVSESGAFYVVTAATFGRAKLLHGEAAGSVAEELVCREWEGLVTNISWVVMPEHLHWMFELRCDSLAWVVQKLKTLSARRIGKMDNRRASVWQSGYCDHRIPEENDLHAQALYIQQNPIRRGLVAAGEKYPYAWCRYPD